MRLIGYHLAIRNADHNQYFNRFYGVLQLSENDSRFVTRTEWLDNNIKVDEKIDKVDRKHTDALKQLIYKSRTAKHSTRIS